MATIYDVAKRAGVSTYTVSSVINRTAYVSPELTERVQEAVRALNYTVNEVARSLQMRRTNTVGMLIPDLRNPFFSQVVDAVEESLRKEGYSLILGCSHNDAEAQARYLKLFSAKQVDGYLVFPAVDGDDALQALAGGSKPMVCVAHQPSFATDCVVADNARGVCLGVEHLIKRGHQRIGLIVGPRKLSVSAERIVGWQATLLKHGLKAPQKLIGVCDDSTQSAEKIASGWFERGAQAPTAIFVAGYPAMVGVVKATRAAGCVDTMDIVVSDDNEWIDAFPTTVSSIRQPGAEMGTAAAELLCKRMKTSSKRGKTVTLIPTLRVR
jgi:LacI family transcriptional regulator